MSPEHSPVPPSASRLGVCACARVWACVCVNTQVRVNVGVCPPIPGAAGVNAPRSPVSPAAAGLDGLRALLPVRRPRQGLQQSDPAGGARQLHLLRESAAGAGRRGARAAHRQQGGAGRAPGRAGWDVSEGRGPERPWGPVGLSCKASGQSVGAPSEGGWHPRAGRPLSDLTLRPGK